MSQVFSLFWNQTITISGFENMKFLVNQDSHYLEVFLLLHLSGDMLLGFLEYYIDICPIKRRGILLQ